MLSVMLTDFCNRSCRFCFAMERLQGHGCELSMSDLDTLIDLHQRWRLPMMKLVGGEPTFHSRFEEIITRIQASGCPVIHLFTNGIMPERKAEFLAGFDNITYLVNYGPPQEYSPAEGQRLETFLEICAPSALYMSIGTTICSRTPSLDYLLQRAIDGNIPEVRIGLAQPIYSHGRKKVNQYLTLDDCRAASEAIVQFVEACAEAGKSVLYDCHFPVCMFTNDQLLRMRDAFPDNRPGFSTDCRQLTVKPNLAVFTCFAVGSVFNRAKITDFASLEDALDYFDERMRHFQATPGYGEQCLKCPLFMRECSSGCLGRKLSKHPVLPEVVESKMDGPEEKRE